MRNSSFLPVVMFGVFVLAVSGLPGLAQDSKFFDREALFDILIVVGDVETALPQLNDKLVDAQNDLEQAQTTFDATLNLFNSNNLDIAERTTVEMLVENLSPEQVFALNRSLNNAVNSGLLLFMDVDAADLQDLLNYDDRQINAFTKAYEEEAKFLARAEATGNERFLQKAENQKDKFLARIERFEAGKQASRQDHRSSRRRHSRRRAHRRSLPNQPPKAAPSSRPSMPRRRRPSKLPSRPPNKLRSRRPSKRSRTKPRTLPGAGRNEPTASPTCGVRPRTRHGKITFAGWPCQFGRSRRRGMPN